MIEKLPLLGIEKTLPTVAMGQIYDITVARDATNAWKQLLMKARQGPSIFSKNKTLFRAF